MLYTCLRFRLCALALHPCFSCIKRMTCLLSDRFSNGNNYCILVLICNLLWLLTSGLVIKQSLIDNLNKLYGELQKPKLTSLPNSTISYSIFVTSWGSVSLYARASMRSNSRPSLQCRNFLSEARKSPFFFSTIAFSIYTLYVSSYYFICLSRQYFKHFSISLYTPRATILPTTVASAKYKTFWTIW